jgi:hydroxymethylpyrimidine kinase/phosphomethylpyrimidine kinase
MGMARKQSVPVARLLTIAGSDSGGGAGIQADLKTFAAHGAFGMSVITAVTAQSTVGVTAVHPIPAEVVAAQLRAVLSDLGADAIKIGMLGGPEVVAAVSEGLTAARGIPIVLDPVMVAKSGATLLAADAVQAVVDRLLSLATLVTPNLPEAARLTGLPLGDEASRVAAGHRLVESGCAALVKGGHATGDTVVDLLVLPGGEVHRYTHPRQQTRSTHGTGCTLSSAIAARLARGEALPIAVGHAIEYLQAAIASAPALGRGHGPVEHFPPGWSAS